MRAWLAASLLATTLFASACVIDGDSSFTIVNDSSFVLVEVNLTEVDSTNWGPNLLPVDLLPGDSVEITDIDCDVYDIRVIDNTDCAYYIYDLDLCFDDDTWFLDDGDLDECEDF
jgi:hypothetical protein